MGNYISVDKQLPKYDGQYRTKSAYYPDGKVMTFVKDTGWDKSNKNVWFVNSTSPTSSVTHWEKI